MQSTHYFTVYIFLLFTSLFFFKMSLNLKSSMRATLKFFANADVSFVLDYGTFLVCADGRYISNGYCVKCKGHCKNDEHCNKLTGECDSGCASQWTGSFCDRTYTCIHIF